MTNKVTSGISGTSENSFYLGDGDDGYKTFYANSAQDPPAFLRNDSNLQEWQVSHKGNIYEKIASLSDTKIWKEINENTSTWSWSYFIDDDNAYFTAGSRSQLSSGQPIRVLDNGRVIYKNTELDILASAANVQIGNDSILEPSGLLYGKNIDDGDGYFHLELYNNMDNGDGYGLVGHTDSFAGSLVLSIIEDNNSGLGGDIETGTEMTAECIFTLDFFRYGVVTYITENKLEYVGHLFVNPQKLYHADSTRVIKMIFHIDGYIDSTQEALLEINNNQFIQWILPNSRIVFQGFKAKAYTDAGVDMSLIWNSALVGAPISVLSGWATSEKSISLLNNRITIGTDIEISGDPVLYEDSLGSIMDVSISVLFVLE